MEQKIEGVYDLTESCKDVWLALNPDSDNEPTADELAVIRETITAHYAWLAKRLGQGYKAWFNDCASWELKLRAGREVADFQGGRFRIPEFFEVEVNASPTMEELIRQELTPPAPNVK